MPPHAESCAATVKKTQPLKRLGIRRGPWPAPNGRNLMPRQHANRVMNCAALALGGLAIATAPAPAAAWEPTKTIEFIVPAGTGGGADQMSRMIQGIVQK